MGMVTNRTERNYTAPPPPQKKVTESVQVLRELQDDDFQDRLRYCGRVLVNIYEYRDYLSNWWWPVLLSGHVNKHN